MGYKPPVVRPALITAAACVLAAAAADPAAASSQTSVPQTPGAATASAADVAPAASTSTGRSAHAIVRDIRWTRRHAVRKARRAALPIPRHGHAERHAVTRADLGQSRDKWDRRLDHYRTACARREPVL